MDWARLERFMSGESQTIIVIVSTVSKSTVKCNGIMIYRNIF